MSEHDKQQPHTHTRSCHHIMLRYSHDHCDCSFPCCFQMNSECVTVHIPSNLHSFHSFITLGLYNRISRILTKLFVLFYRIMQLFSYDGNYCFIETVSVCLSVRPSVRRPYLLLESTLKVDGRFYCSY